MTTDVDLLATLSYVGLAPIPVSMERKLVSCGLEQLVERVIFSHPEPSVDADAMVVAQHVTDLGFLPEVAIKIATRAAVYTSMSSHREAVTCAALHFVGAESSLPAWLDGNEEYGVPKNVAMSSSPGSRRVTKVTTTTTWVNGIDDEAGSGVATFDDVLQPTPGRRLLFHGTSVDGAGRIIDEGVSLSAGHAAQDFSTTRRRGYYVCDNFEWAVARGKQKCSFEDRLCAVVVHDVPDDFDVSYPGVHAEGAQWTSLVRSCRMHDAWPQHTCALDPSFVDGLACSNPQSIGPPCCREPRFDHVGGATHYQLCVVNDALAARFTEWVSCVAFVRSVVN